MHPAEVDHDFPELRTSAVQAHEVSGTAADVHASADRFIHQPTPHHLQTLLMLEHP